MIKALLIRILFRLIDGPLYEHPADKEKIKDWMVMSWTHPGFRAFVNHRDSKIIHELAGGMGMTELKRDDYIRKIGQRVETLFMASQAKKQFEARQKERSEVKKPKRFLRRVKKSR